MKVEVPIFGRCCCCVPVRYGILVFGYINLLMSLLLSSVSLYYSMISPFDNKSSHHLYHGLIFFSADWVPIVLCYIEAIFNILLIYGCHRKQVKYIRAYYYYGIMTTLAIFLTYIATRSGTGYSMLFIEEIGLLCSSLIIHIYLLLLIRSELKKIKDNTQIVFVNTSEESDTRTNVAYGKI